MGKVFWPKNWPSQLPYISVPQYSKNITREQLEALRRPPSAGTVDIISACDIGGEAVKVVSITDPSHPACGQAGLFTARDFKPGQPVVQYVGKLHSFQSHQDVVEHAGSDYDLWLDREAGIAIDAAVAGNEARFINDYRGIADAPNAEFREVWDASRRERGIAVFVLPQRKDRKAKQKTKGAGVLKKRSEILVSYGKGFWSNRDGGE